MEYAHKIGDHVVLDYDHNKFNDPERRDFGGIRIVEIHPSYGWHMVYSTDRTRTLFARYFKLVGFDATDFEYI